MDDRTGSVLPTKAASLAEKGMGLWKQVRPGVSVVATVALLSGALWVLLYYITGPSLGYFHSDCSDSLLWSWAMVETGEILSDRFAYAAILPFGSPLWMVPILKLFGYTMKAQIASMAVFAVLFVASSLFLFRSLRWSYPLSAGGTFLLSMLLSGSVKLREIMWEHVIYYSLGILLLMLFLGIAIRLYHCLRQTAQEGATRNHTVRTVIWSVCLALLCVGCATDGMQMLAISAVPVAFAFVMLALCDGTHKLLSLENAYRGSIAVFMGIGSVIGLMLLKVLTRDGAIAAGYENAYSKWSPLTEWMDNALTFPKQYLSLFGVEIDEAASLFSMASILMMVRLIGAVLILVCPIVMLICYRRLKEDSSRLVLWSHLLVSAVILLGFVCGKLSAANWRLVPMLGSGILATLVFLKEMIFVPKASVQEREATQEEEREEKQEKKKPVGRRLIALVAAVPVCCSLLHAKTILDMPYDYGKDSPVYTIIDTLEEKNYTVGYATFWQSNKITLMSDGRIRAVTVNVTVDHGVTPRAYQTMTDWFEDVEGQETYFLLLTVSEYNTMARSDYWDEIRQERKIVDAFECEGYRILVFDGNLFLN
ncbi:MAG: hypothetical protein IJY42_01080 [Clostridia bacterium]|nr:hypothetical protein [Clostridia bacterium]